MYTLPGRAPSDIPVVETERLRLRASKAADFEPLYAMWQDTEYVRFIGNRKRSSGEVWTNLQKNIGAWAMFGYSYWSIEDRQSGQYVGECGFALARRAEITPALPMIPEAGWGITPAYWGKGVAKEAMQAAMSWALSQDRYFPSQCIIDVDHKASEKIAFSLGFKFKREVPFSDETVNLYERPPGQS
ncbi:GNAT family N-acetyltransferase [Ponticaulis profundi]|uniref:GNAT family N-acetyltransferase n=1 Tax=Ponticaulis profundi TaxID=2665222 RepID=A0ABW1SAX1_9PROT